MIAALDTVWLTLATLVVAFYYFALMAVSAVVDRRRERLRPPDPSRRRRVVVLVIPARNEERVIANTLASLDQLTYLDRVVMVMDDGSTDATAACVEQSQGIGEVHLLQRSPEDAGFGKGDVLNHAYSLVWKALTSDHPLLGGRDPDDVIIGVMDADGRLDPSALDEVVPLFDDPQVAAVQLGVRIENSTNNVLTRMQDIEFVGFSGLVQNARNALGSVGLGGNGQFTRLSALADLGDLPWSDCLSEDLDLSLKLVQAGHSVRFCGRTYVAQQGLTRLRPLLRQRARWVQGHYQCWRHIVPLLRNRRVSLKTKLDLTTYLTMISFLVLITVGVLLSVFSLVGLIEITNSFWAWVPDGLPRNAALLILSAGPAVTFVYIYQRRAATPLRFFEVPAYTAAFCLYGYHWLVAQAWAFSRMATRTRGWAKTPRELQVAA